MDLIFYNHCFTRTSFLRIIPSFGRLNTLSYVTCDLSLFTHPDKSRKRFIHCYGFKGLHQKSSVPVEIIHQKKKERKKERRKEGRGRKEGRSEGRTMGGRKTEKKKKEKLRKFCMFFPDLWPISLWTGRELCAKSRYPQELSSVRVNSFSPWLWQPAS